MLSMRANNPELVALLILHHADPNIKNAKLKTPLELAGEAGNWDCAKAFLQPRRYSPDVTQLILFYLFLAHNNPMNRFSTLPFDVAKIILDFTLGDKYDYAAADGFAREYGQFGLFKKAVGWQPPALASLISTIEQTVHTRQPIGERFSKIHTEVEKFVKQDGKNNVEATQTLIELNLLQPEKPQMTLRHLYR